MLPGQTQAELGTEEPQEAPGWLPSLLPFCLCRQELLPAGCAVLGSTLAMLRQADCLSGMGRALLRAEIDCVPSSLGYTELISTEKPGEKGSSSPSP